MIHVGSWVQTHVQEEEHTPYFFPCLITCVLSWGSSLWLQIGFGPLVPSGLRPGLCYSIMAVFWFSQERHRKDTDTIKFPPSTYALPSLHLKTDMKQPIPPVAEVSWGLSRHVDVQALTEENGEDKRLTQGTEGAERSSPREPGFQPHFCQHHGVRHAPSPFLVPTFPTLWSFLARWAISGYMGVTSRQT